MGIGFMLDPAMDLDDFEGCDDDNLTAEALKFKSVKRRAEVVFAIPTSPAASERAWSVFKHIHSKRRCRLSVDKVEMLAYIYINHGTISKDKVDLARHRSRPDSVIK
ncbi:uncharacterized protein PITG_19296 [Phytophthora infestans T30-4]|uniref:HAT C-terminal dimerisation domain-containing protein n=1 Tax=Phytophthora infestans (strain T30-4) TaxID=403677 RepID=D0NZW0_PHYIT|nr:uncharacterized protein PITG_19296 [Phytophthora infestans T30-4]EEY69676.1 conserved hypothetical protein [Phytophthora infestans T30-4]|eukprot:XP_002997088.1 conserved hypothetical protein [Phytophthora infestans T30-4]